MAAARAFFEAQGKKQTAQFVKLDVRVGATEKNGFNQFRVTRHFVNLPDSTIDAKLYGTVTGGEKRVAQPSLAAGPTARPLIRRAMRVSVTLRIGTWPVARRQASFALRGHLHNRRGNWYGSFNCTRASIFRDLCFEVIRGSTRILRYW